MPHMRAWLGGCTVWLAVIAAGCGSGTEEATTSGGSATTGSGGATGAGGSTSTMATGSGGGGAGSTGTMGTGGAGQGGGGAAGNGGSGGGGALCAADADCDDGLYCNGAEVCDPANGDPVTGCASSGPPCDDGVDCTVDSCDEAIQACAHVPVDGLCDNGLTCDGVEHCDAQLGCLSVGGLDCDDGVACTSDFCDAATDACAHAPDNGACSNGQFCDGAEICDPTQGCQPGVVIDCNDGIPCTSDSCDEAAGQCAHGPDHVACADGMFCNGAEQCDLTLGCVSGMPVACDDGRSCTADACDEAQQHCVSTPNNAACDDGLLCNGAEICSASGPSPSGCVMGNPPTCPSDGVGCTTDACDEAAQGCTYAPNHASCAQGQICSPQQGGCVQGQACSSSAECQDNNLCNGAETCSGGVCVPGQQVNCNDLVGCTVDSCNPATGQCTNAPNNAACDDGFACNGVESCNAQMGCVLSTPPVDCDDGMACTYDMCQEPSGTCAHYGQDFACDDGNVCNGAETCDVQLGCQPSQVPFECPDAGSGCTTSVCNPVINACVQVADNSSCGCGQTCDAQTGACGNFCVVKECQGHVYACGDCIDNDGDCAIDDADDQCMGPCDNTEDSFFGGIPGQNNSPCKSDCYFDQDTGSGNDDCYWSHKCDPLEVAPNYPPEGSQCQYNPNTSIPGYGGSCSQAFASQSAECLGYCGPLTPNGCDCFGCCEFPGLPYTVWLGSVDASGEGSCSLNTLDDPSLCKPCTQVAACNNTCGHCEVCIGKPDLPPDCTVQECPAGNQACGQPGQALCPAGQTCITGCCQPSPQ